MNRKTDLRGALLSAVVLVLAAPLPGEDAYAPFMPYTKNMGYLLNQGPSHATRAKTEQPHRLSFFFIAALDIFQASFYIIENVHQ